MATQPQLGHCDDLVRGGFTGDRVSRALALDGIDTAVIYGSRLRLVAVVVASDR
ncbi:MAG TPA: hypothetical protein VGH66_08970 [Acidimicrobiales bacterium]|jgi:hypothetical protein